jgi:hypothetical protein
VTKTSLPPSFKSSSKHRLRLCSKHVRRKADRRDLYRNRPGAGKPRRRGKCRRGRCRDLLRRGPTRRKGTVQAWCRGICQASSGERCPQHLTRPHAVNNPTSLAEIIPSRLSGRISVLGFSFRPTASTGRDSNQPGRSSEGGFRRWKRRAKRRRVGVSGTSSGSHDWAWVRRKHCWLDLLQSTTFWETPFDTA